ncbi:MAG: hypothetical protein IH596_03255 [Bacteroidales bacterium]|nr:hypothetical protein [Bacteroidales bacterium]
MTVPFTLDHNRMLVDGKIQRNDSTWRKAVLWVDTGNPDLFLSPELANDLGIELPTDSLLPDHGFVEVFPPKSIRLAGMELNLDSVTCYVVVSRYWFFTASHCDMNLPSTILKRYDVVLDYPERELTLAKPGEIKFNGLPVAADIRAETGIIQIEAMMEEDSLSFALDNGASYSFGSTELLDLLQETEPDLPVCTGAVGCANIWGLVPREESWAVVRIPKLKWGAISLTDVGMTIPPDFTPDGKGMMNWYSQKTVHPVDGFLGPNAYNAFCLGIDYRNQLIYFYQSGEPEPNDMDLVGLTLHPEADSSWVVIGVARTNGKPLVEGVKAGDKLLQIDDLKTTGATMGTVVDALRGKPGEKRTVILERNGARISVVAKITRII